MLRLVSRINRSVLRMLRGKRGRVVGVEVGVVVMGEMMIINISNVCDCLF